MTRIDRGKTLKPAAPAAGATKKGTADLPALAEKLHSPIFISEATLPDEAGLLAHFQHWLHISTLDDQVPEQKLLQAATATAPLPPSARLTDPSFPATETSFDPSTLGDHEVEWTRASGPLYHPGASHCALQAGLVDTSWFLGALAAVATQTERLLDVFVSNAAATAGLYTFQFHKHGAWHQVVVDDHLPVFPGSSAPACAHSTSSGEMWPGLVEKAYAKLHGSYAALADGNSADALEDLTGGVCVRVDLHSGLKATTAPSQRAAEAQRHWAAIQESLDVGCVATCSAERPGLPPSQQRLDSGLLANKLYTILETLTIDDEIRLLRVYSPWRDGLWSGAWSTGHTAEWRAPEHAAARQEVAHTLGDGQTFWITFEDFLESFNTLLVLHTFPPAWHQLSIQSGWAGPSAGGPYTLPDGARCPSWPCNPQFRLRVRAACEVVVCLGSRDPSLPDPTGLTLGRPHTQDDWIGLTVCQSEVDREGRVWEVAEQQVVQEVPAAGSRQVAARFTAGPSRAYYVVPHKAAPGVDGPFVLRMFAGAAMELEQCASPMSLVLGGQWQSYQAGGNPSYPSWGSNPQYLLTSGARAAQVVITLQRTDVGCPPPDAEVQQDELLGFALVKPVVGKDGVPDRRPVIGDPSHLALDSGFASASQSMVVTTLQPNTPLLLVPCTHGPGIEASYQLTILSASPLQLLPLPAIKTVVLPGRWAADTAGGCDLHDSWPTNPMYRLSLQRRERVAIRVLRPHGTWRSGTSLTEMVGFYVLALPPDSRSHEVKTLYEQMRSVKVYESTFHPMMEAADTVELDGGREYVIVPCTFSPGVKASFQLAVSGDQDFGLEPLPPPRKPHPPPSASASMRSLRRTDTFR